MYRNINKDNWIEVTTGGLIAEKWNNYKSRFYVIGIFGCKKNTPDFFVRIALFWLFFISAVTIYGVMWWNYSKR